MKEEAKSIFTIERRKNLRDAFAKYFEDLRSVVITSTRESYTMFRYLDYCLRYWPHRCGATGIDDYLKEIGVDITAPKEDKDLLLILELLINLLHWAPKQDYNDGLNTGFGMSLNNDVKCEADRLLQNADYILEQCCNMMVREEDDDNFPKYFITKRNPHVDAAVLAAPELKNALLGYMDIRNADDIEYKKSVLMTIYGFMEPHRKEYKGLTCSAISEELFICMNTFGIRHNTKSQIKMQKKKKIAVYDKLFMMAIYVLQTAEVNNYKNDLSELRTKK